MSTNSNDRGRAYEYAWMNALCCALQSSGGKARILHNSSFEANERAWGQMNDEMRQLLQLSADSAVDTILESEPLMCDGSELLLSFQRDSAGTDGDVRDIVIKRDDISWEIGLSIKHNHEAVKHSRLSHRLDFGKEWFHVPCSRQYWDAVQPIFDRLKREKSNKAKWSAIADKEQSVYLPLLRAFMDEINRAYAADTDMPKKMVEYLIGTNDYYKAVSHDSKRLTVIHTFNIHGTLNRPSKRRISAIFVPVVELPTELVALRLKPNSTNTVEMYLNNGWQLSFRIHNASTNVEPSLKFDVQFIGSPATILNIECRWR